MPSGVYQRKPGRNPRRRPGMYQCPNCRGSLRSLSVLVDPRCVWRCYTCRKDFIMRQKKWSEVPREVISE
jgi:hypothetical protein